MQDFSATDAAIAGFSLAGRKPGALLVWSLAHLLFGLAFGAATVLLIGPDMQKMAGPDLSAALTDTATRGQMFASLARVQMVTLPILMAWSAVQSCAVYRALLRPDDKGLGYLKLGIDELRMVGLFLLYGLLFVVAYVVMFIAVVLIAVVFSLLIQAMGKGAAQSALAVILGVAAVLGPLLAFGWVSVRLSLSGPMTFNERRIRLWPSWKLTKGRFWALSGAYLISSVLGFVVLVTGSCLALLIGFGVTHQGLGGLYQAAFRPDYGSLAAFFSPSRLVVLLVQSLFAGLFASVWYAPSAEAYRLLAGLAAVPAATTASADPETPAPPKGPWG